MNEVTKDYSEFITDIEGMDTIFFRLEILTSCILLKEFQGSKHQPDWFVWKC